MSYNPSINDTMRRAEDRFERFAGEEEREQKIVTALQEIAESLALIAESLDKIAGGH